MSTYTTFDNNSAVPVTINNQTCPSVTLTESVDWTFR